MVTVDYYGRSGNNWFQYAYARILAKCLGLYLKTEAPKTFLKVRPWENSGLEIVGPVVEQVNDTNAADMCNKVPAQFHCNGYFQDANLFNQYAAIVRDIWELPLVRMNYNDIVIHLRLTDYWWYRNKTVISPKWYFDILNRERFNKLYIVVEPHISNTKYLSFFTQKFKNVEIVSGTPEQDFHFIRSFTRIVCSNSTFAWWAAFLSDAHRVYTFLPWYKGLNLAYMQGARMIDGQFYRDRALEALDWTNYWEKKWPLPKA